MKREQIVIDALYSTENNYILTSRQAGTTTLINEIKTLYNALYPDKRVLVYDGGLTSIDIRLPYDLVILDTNCTEFEYETLLNPIVARKINKIIYFSFGTKIGSTFHKLFMEQNKPDNKLSYKDNPYVNSNMVNSLKGRYSANVQSSEYDCEFYM